MTTIPTTVGQPEAVRLAEAMGHTMRWDGRVANRSRWVCVRCDDPVYDNGEAIFGPAKRERCGSDRGDAEIAVILLVLVMFIAAFGFTFAVVRNHTGHVSCLRLSEQTGLETRYARSGANGECYIKVDGRWVPEDRWRNIGGD